MLAKNMRSIGLLVGELGARAGRDKMESRKFACLIAAGLIGFGLVGAATQAGAAPPPDVTVKGKSIDPETQRTVSYADLNLALRADQKVLNRRIYRTAGNLCSDLGYLSGSDYFGCRGEAIHSTDDQVAAAVNRAKLRMAGLPAGPAVAISMVIGTR